MNARYFAEFPEELNVLDCEWNLRTDSKCLGKYPQIVHGNRNVFNNTWSFLSYNYV